MLVWKEASCLGQRSIGLGLARGGQRGHPPKKFLAVLWFCAFRHVVPKPNAVAPVFQNIYPPKILGWLRYCNVAHFCDCCCNMRQFLCGAEQWRRQEFCSGWASHLTFVWLFLPFIFDFRTVEIDIKHQRKILASLCPWGVGVWEWWGGTVASASFWLRY